MSWLHILAERMERRFEDRLTCFESNIKTAIHSAKETIMLNLDRLNQASANIAANVQSLTANCRVVISRGQAPFGSFGSVPTNKTVLKLLVTEIPAPVRDATIDADGSTFTLVKELSNDGAISNWEVL